MTFVLYYLSAVIFTLILNYLFHEPNKRIEEYEKELNKKTKLILALQQTENIYTLVQDNNWIGFFSSHLLPIKFEIERQLSMLTFQENQSKIDE